MDFWRWLKNYWKSNKLRKEEYELSIFSWI
jgi:hypothetical protein